MPKGEAEKAAQKKLDEAVAEYIVAAGWNKNMVTTSWVLIAHQTGFTDDGKHSISGHPMIHMNGEQPDHVVLGLLQIGIDTTRGVGRWRREDEEDD